MKKVLSLTFALLFASCFTVSFAQSKGYEKSVEANGGIALDNYSRFSFGLSMINGYRFNNYFSIGALVGYEYFDALNLRNYYRGTTTYWYAVKSLIKIGGRAKANFSKGKVSPFLSFDAGYSIHIGSASYSASGLYLEPAFGVDFKLQEKQKIYVMLGYHAQKNRYYRLSSATTSSERDFLVSLFDVRIGFAF